MVAAFARALRRPHTPRRVEIYAAEQRRRMRGGWDPTRLGSGVRMWQADQGVLTETALQFAAADKGYLTNSDPGSYVNLIPNPNGESGVLGYGVSSGSSEELAAPKISDEGLATTGLPESLVAADRCVMFPVGEGNIKLNWNFPGSGGLSLSPDTQYTASVYIYLRSTESWGVVRARVEGFSDKSGDSIFDYDESLTDQWQRGTLTFTTGDDVTGLITLVSDDTISTAGKDLIATGFQVETAASVSAFQDPVLRLGTGDFSFAFAFRRDSTGGQWIAGCMDSSDAEYRLGIDASNHLRFQAWDDSPSLVVDVEGATALTSTSGWYHGVVVVDRDAPANCRIYVDGSDDTSGTPTATGTTNIPNADTFVIGKQSATATTQLWDGRIDQVGFWRRAVTSDEVSALYASGSGMLYDDVAAHATLSDAKVYYSMDASQGEVVFDRAGTGADLVPTNDAGADPSPVAGVTAGSAQDANRATSFNGTTQYGSHATAFAPGDESWWLAVTLRPTEAGAGQGFLGVWDAAGNGREVRLDYTAASKIQVQASPNGTSVVSATTADALAQDVMGVVFVHYDDVADLLYVRLDDGPAASVSLTGGTHQGSAALNIGGVDGGASLLACEIDAVLWGTETDGWDPSTTTPDAVSAFVHNGGRGRKGADLTTAEKATYGVADGWDMQGSLVSIEGGMTLTNVGSFVLGDAEGLNYTPGLVGTWQDQSDNANHMTQTTLSKRPEFHSNVFGTKGGVVLDGVDDDMAFSEVALSGDFDTFILYRDEGTVAHHSYMSGGSKSFLRRLSGGTRVDARDESAVLGSLSGVPNPGSGVTLANFRRTGTTIEFFQNGVDEGDLSGSFSGDMDLLTLGRRGGSEFFDGKVGVVLIVPSYLSDAQRDRVENWLVNWSDDTLELS